MRSFKMGLRNVIFFLALTEILDTVSSLTCLSCHGIFQPRHCHNVIECLPNEYCSVERYLDDHGQTYYNVGCQTQDRCGTNNTVHGCVQCCNSTLCNARGCGEPGYPLNSGQVCYKCDQIPPHHTCYSIEICNSGEVCAIEETEEFGDVMLSSGCIPMRECSTTAGGVYLSTLVGKKRGTPQRKHVTSNCKKCCNGTLCNKDCKGSTSTLSTTLQTSSASTATTSILKVTSTTSPTAAWLTAEGNFSDCAEIQRMVNSAKTGPYFITYRSLYFNLWCDMETDGGGWTVLERRFDGSVDFYRNRSEYKYGFGYLSSGGEFWLGLEEVYDLTKGQSNEIRVEEITHEGLLLYSHYSNFSVGPPPHYTLYVSGGSGNASNELEYFNGMPFSAMDDDQSVYNSNCAKTFQSAFWFKNCLRYANINGPYRPGSVDLRGSPSMTYSTKVGSSAITLMFRRRRV